METVPLSVKEAEAFLAKHERHYKAPVEAICAIGVQDSEGLHGAAILGRRDAETAELAHIYVDGVSQGTYAIPIGQGLSVYDTAVYDTGTYDGVGRRKWHHLLPLGAEGRTLALKQTYVGQSRFRSFTYATVVLPETAPRSFTE